MSTTTQSHRGRGHRAGLFDIRNIIGALLTVDGLIIFLMGLFGDTEEDKTGGVNANLWSGLALLVVGIAFLAWAKLRPVVVPDDFEAGGEEGGPAGH
ncbi:hypothetical protein ISU10_16820 [Nocardioides agariphilus]|jgi:hypothetical protein|uniref:Uncharacterized protein n=1 Tax=Nocardioides agariphilus TaxID=433664 RepID=A0A930VKY6_9ACTN|nr:hypothetical protein [Nocardioides agariphilus]MBF4769434.1 hypothetical protein [Nocardioides agariphilus]